MVDHRSGVVIAVGDCIGCRRLVEAVAWLGTSTSEVSHPVLRPKPDAHRMYAQDQVVIHTVRM
jgi:hypothetical protein